MSIAALDLGETTRIARQGTPVTLAVIHPKGGVGRSTTVWHLGAELAMRGLSVRIEDLDQGAHLSRVFHAHPLGLDNLQLGGNVPADLVILDTAPDDGDGHLYITGLAERRFRGTYLRCEARRSRRATRHRPTPRNRGAPGV